MASAAIAFELANSDASQEEAVRVLKDISEKTSVIDQLHIISHGTSGNVTHPIPEGATNRQIIALIEQALE